MGKNSLETGRQQITNSKKIFYNYCKSFVIEIYINKLYYLWKDIGQIDNTAIYRIYT